MMLRKVISGGQTCVDRAGLDAAIEAGIPVGGYCPKGRLSEDGVVPDSYPLQELDSTEYHIRTEKNVVESDGTLILGKGPLSNGTKLTYEYTAEHLKPCLIVQFDGAVIVEPVNVVRWIKGQQVAILNIAGPRESKVAGGIYAEAFEYMTKVLTLIKDEM